MKLETWASLAALGLAVMSAAIMVAFYNFLIGPDHKGPNTQVDAQALVVQEVSISAIPSVVISVFVFLMGRNYGNVAAGGFIIGAGAVLIAGMVGAINLLPQIQHQYLVGGVVYFPYVFLGAGGIIIVLGGYLVTVSKKRRAQSLDDLR